MVIACVCERTHEYVCCASLLWVQGFPAYLRLYIEWGDQHFIPNLLYCLVPYAGWMGQGLQMPDLYIKTDHKTGF